MCQTVDPTKCTLELEVGVWLEENVGWFCFTAYLLYTGKNKNNADV